MSLIIREAQAADLPTISELMQNALSPYYGGDHGAHAERIFSTHITGGRDRIGHFSFEQKMFVGEVDGEIAGMVHIVGKRQGTHKISPLIVSPQFRGNRGIGSALLEWAESYAKTNGSRQIYCTVAMANESALSFFLRKGYVIAGSSDSHYKAGVKETMLYKLFDDPQLEEKHDALNISIIPMEKKHEDGCRELILSTLPRCFNGITEDWLTALFEGYERRDSKNINSKYKLIYVAVDYNDNVLGVAGATPKKGEPIKVMPLVASCHPAFVALLRDLPKILEEYGHKLYIHIVPSVDETIVLQRLGWSLDAAMPAAYHPLAVTQQWSYSIGGNLVRTMRVKQHYLDQISSGQKRLEVRVGYENIQTIRPGETIRFASHASEKTIKVKGVRKYPNFAEMLDHEDADAIVPGKNKLQVLWLLREIYNEEREALGVIVLEIEVL